MASRWARLTGSVRVRTTLAATLIVAIALSLGSAIVVWRFRVSLDNNRRNAAIARAEDIASLASTGRVPALLALPSQDATYAQIIDGRGQVLAASANIAGEPALGPPVPFRSGPVVRSVPNSPIDGDGRFRLVSVPAGSPDHPLTVLAGYSLVGSDFAVHDVKLAVFIGLPLLLLLVSGTTWLIVGRALRPIDAIRSEVAEISAVDLHRRVPQPPSGDEVARLAETMNSMLDRLEASVERQKAFVADASHELRSPLASLRAQLEVGLAAGASTDWGATVSGALAEEARIERMVRDLLLLARLDLQPGPASAAGYRVSDDAPVLDLGEIVAADLDTRPRRPGVVVRVETAGQAPVVMSKELARRLVANLVDNAQRYAASQVDVTLKTDRGGWVELVVQDDGPGIAPADRERVFERFTRLDPARSADDGGAGLGLAIVRDIVTRHGGTVRFVDCPTGARAVVRLPLSEASRGPFTTKSQPAASTAKKSRVQPTRY